MHHTVDKYKQTTSVALTGRHYAGCTHVPDTKCTNCPVGAYKHNNRLPLMCIYLANICDVCEQLKHLVKDENIISRVARHVHSAGIPAWRSYPARALGQCTAPTESLQTSTRRSSHCMPGCAAPQGQSIQVCLLGTWS